MADTPTLPTATVTDIRHGSPEWHEARAKCITCSSDVPAILGASSFSTPYDVWMRLVLGQGGNFGGNSFTRWGTLLEPIAAQAYEEETGRRVIPNDRWLTSWKYPWLAGTPDGFLEPDPFSGSEAGPGVIEFKAPGPWSLDQWAEGQAPGYYVAQLRGYLALTGLRWGVLCAILPPTSHDAPLIATTYVELSDEERLELLHTLERWHERHVLGEEQPPAIAADLPTIRDMHPDDEQRVHVFEDDTLATWVAAKEEADAAKRRADDLKARVAQAMGGAAWGTTPDGELNISHRTNARGAKALKTLRALPKGAPAPEVSRD